MRVCLGSKRERFNMTLRFVEGRSVRHALKRRGGTWRLCVLGSSLLLSGCAMTPAASIPESLRPGPDERFAFELSATGTQNYECRVVDGKAAWAFVAPEAELFGAGRRLEGTHYAGPTWDLSDGSKTVGTVKARADAPVGTAIPWLLLTARSTGGPGKLAPVTSIQRVNTVGGLAPSLPCDAGKAGTSVKVPYTADYRYFVRAG